MIDPTDSFNSLVVLIAKFLNGLVSPVQFKKEYMQQWRVCRDSGHLDDFNACSNGAFDRIFTASDTYCEYVELRDSSDTDERQFAEEVRRIFLDIKH